MGLLVLTLKSVKSRIRIEVINANHAGLRYRITMSELVIRENTHETYPESRSSRMHVHSEHASNRRCHEQAALVYASTAIQLKYSRRYLLAPSRTQSVDSLAIVIGGSSRGSSEDGRYRTLARAREGRQEKKCRCT